MKVIQNVNAKPVKLPHFNNLLTRKQASQAIKKGVNEAILLMRIKEALFSK